MKTTKKIIIMFILFLFILLPLGAISIAHNRVFSRADYDKYDTNYFNLYEDIGTIKYKREKISILSGENRLSAYLYGVENTKGLIIISPGHRDASDIKLPEITYFVDKGWSVLCYDYTGCYSSEGKNMVGYIQAPKDLNAVINYVQSQKRFEKIPIMLFGHSLGAYASTVVLKDNKNIRAVVAASGFNDPVLQWQYSIKRFTGVFGDILSFYAKAFMKIIFGGIANYTAIEGINSVETPILIMEGTNDEYYGEISSIFTVKDKITNKNTILRLMDEKNHNGHYDYFLSDNAVEYRRKVEKDNIQKIDKFLYIEHSEKTMNYINNFFLKALKK